MQEFDIIARYFAPLAVGEKAALGLKDDAAIMALPAACDLVVTKDAIVEGVHFMASDAPSLIARKLLRVNLSDLAAMGAKPYGYLLAIMLPDTKGEAWIADFAEGLRIDQEAYGITLLGGDTTRTPGVLSLSVTMLGHVPQGKALKRAGAQEGDAVYVTGSIGDAALGLEIVRGRNVDGIEAGARQRLLERYLLPCPRVAFGEAVRDIATACIDISDGLMQDMGHIADRSQVGATLHWHDIPLSDGVPRSASLYEKVLAGGDDYELLFTAPATAHETLLAIAARLGVRLARIGRMTHEKEVRALDKAGKEIILMRKGYQHF